MSRNNKAVFLKTVREALGHPASRRRPAPPGLFHDRPSEKSQALLERIKSRRPAERRVLIETLRRAAGPIQLDIRIVASTKEAAAAIADRIESSPTEWGGPRRVCAWDHPLIDAMALSAVLAERDIPVISSGSFLPASAGQVSIDDMAALRRGIIDSFVGVTAADFCLADTATLVLRARPGRPRSVSLVPSMHIAVITADRVLADLQELYAVLRWGEEGPPADLTNCMTFISGPSKTADIEATLVHGAHGPKAVCLFLVAPE